eukprot:Ihof_evm2s466 gene=Ihof_evmTU2s466
MDFAEEDDDLNLFDGDGDESLAKALTESLPDFNFDEDDDLADPLGLRPSETQQQNGLNFDGNNGNSNNATGGNVGNSSSNCGERVEGCDNNEIVHSEEGGDRNEDHEGLDPNRSHRPSLVQLTGSLDKLSQQQPQGTGAGQQNGQQGIKTNGGGLNLPTPNTLLQIGASQPGTPSQQQQQQRRQQQIQQIQQQGQDQGGGQVQGQAQAQGQTQGQGPTPGQGQTQTQGPGAYGIHGNPNPQHRSSTGTENQLVYQLRLILHAAGCKGECPQRSCQAMKRILQHVLQCRDEQCQVQHCRSIKSIVVHYRSCTRHDCPICVPATEDPNQQQAQQQVLQQMTAQASATSSGHLGINQTAGDQQVVLSLFPF